MEHSIHPTRTTVRRETVAARMIEPFADWQVPILDEQHIPAETEAKAKARAGSSDVLWFVAASIVAFVIWCIANPRVFVLTQGVAFLAPVGFAAVFGWLVWRGGLRLKLSAGMSVFVFAACLSFPVSLAGFALFLRTFYGAYLEGFPSTTDPWLFALAFSSIETLFFGFVGALLLYICGTQATGWRLIASRKVRILGCKRHAINLSKSDLAVCKSKYFLNRRDVPLVLAATWVSIACTGSQWSIYHAAVSSGNAFDQAWADSQRTRRAWNVFDNDIQWLRPKK
jgi:hypothetical protein